MPDLLGVIIGGGSIAMIAALFRCADDLGDGNVERLEREQSDG